MKMCESCGSVMRSLFFDNSLFCPNECDKKKFLYEEKKDELLPQKYCYLFTDEHSFLTMDVRSNPPQDKISRDMVFTTYQQIGKSTYKVAFDPSILSSDHLAKYVKVKKDTAVYGNWRV